MLNTLFLLGGQDLEMLEIRALLEKNEVSFCDKRLNWKSSELIQYRSEIETASQDDHIYAVELRSGNFTPSREVTLIDHHDPLPSRPSALEQVAEIIGVSLQSRYHQLVIANDIGHIVAMQKLNATVEEIAKIRKLDRAAQGVTQLQENIGKQEVAAALNRTAQDDIVILKTELNIFSPLADRLHGRPCIIYNQHSLNTYGNGTLAVRSKMPEMIETHVEYDENVQYWYGGGSGQGYFGLTAEGMNLMPTSEILGQLKNMMQA